MSRKPTVHVTYEQEAVDVSTFAEVDQWRQAGIQLDLTFRLHDHEGALRLLDAAVADVRAQIEETK